jgi:uncharacterized protein YqjF (DUF2071 family)
MKLPVIRGVIERRILANYRVDPDVLAGLLPRPFQPQVVDGYGVAGICLIRLGHIRPQGFPQWLGISSENAAHRVAVEWEERGEIRRGVYVLRRDTNSRLNVLGGGRIFPGIHNRATFHVSETASRFHVAVASNDGEVAIDIAARLIAEWPTGSIFASQTEASVFFEAGSLGYSPSRAQNRFQGLELRCDSWHVQPLNIETVSSSVFDDESIFPRGSISLDCGLLMRGIEHQWNQREELCCSEARADYAAAGSSLAATADTTSA